MKFALLATLSSCLSRGEGHGYMSSPRSRFHITNPASYKNDPVYTLQEGPAFGFSDTAMRCRDRPALEPSTTLVAGGTINYELNLAAYHIGDCAFYVSTPCNGSECDAPEFWFKIANFPGCPLTGTINISDAIPASEHSVFRWEWSAHHVVGLDQVEFYVACHDVQIDSTAGPGRPEPLVTIASPDPVGHLSSVASDYRDLSLPISTRAGNMVGPDVATWSPCVVGTNGCIASDGFVSPPTPPSPQVTNAPSPQVTLSNAPSPNLRVSTIKPTTLIPTTSPPVDGSTCTVEEWGLCNLLNGIYYGCCTEGLACIQIGGEYGGYSQCRQQGGSFLAPTSKPSNVITSAPTSSAPSNRPSKINDGTCFLQEWNVCGVDSNGYEYGCCSEGLICQEVEGAGISQCKDTSGCANWCNEYTTTLPDCINCPHVFY